MVENEEWERFKNVLLFYQLITFSSGYKIAKNPKTGKKKKCKTHTGSLSSQGGRKSFLLLLKVTSEKTCV